MALTKTSNSISMCKFKLLLVFLLSSSIIFGQTELISNGDFETGDFSNWTVATSPEHSININDGTFFDNCYQITQSPFNGNFDVVFDQVGPGTGLLSSGFIVPSNLSSATFSFTYEYDNSAADFSFSTGFEQYFIVEILDSVMVPIDTFFMTEPGDPLIVTETNFSLDILLTISGYEGQMMYLRMDQTDTQDCLPVRIDDVSIFVEAGAVVPTMGQWGLMILGLCVVIFGVVEIKKRQAVLAS